LCRIATPNGCTIHASARCGAAKAPHPMSVATAPCRGFEAARRARERIPPSRAVLETRGRGGDRARPRQTKGVHEPSREPAVRHFRNGDRREHGHQRVRRFGPDHFAERERRRNRRLVLVRRRHVVDVENGLRRNGRRNRLPRFRVRHRPSSGAELCRAAARCLSRRCTDVEQSGASASLRRSGEHATRVRSAARSRARTEAGHPPRAPLRLPRSASASSRTPARAPPTNRAAHAARAT